MARPAVFVSGVGGKTVRSRRVTEQWNRKRAARARERERERERDQSARERDRERNRNTKKERTRRTRTERKKDERDSNFFPALDSSSFISHE